MEEVARRMARRLALLISCNLSLYSAISSCWLVLKVSTIILDIAEIVYYIMAEKKTKYFHHRSPKSILMPCICKTILMT